MIDRGTPLLDPLARALMEEIAEGVVIFDMRGRVAYVNASARAAMRKARIEHGDRSSMLPRLSRLGSRLSPIWVGSAKICEMVFLPADLRGERGRHTLADREREAILETLDATGWKLTESARRLGISRTTLWRRLRAYDIDRDKRARWSSSS
jgi:DNA-binding NtrC family response regulator